MKPIIKNILAIISGIIAGSLVNTGIILVSGSMIPPPNRADVTTLEELESSMHLFQAKHFIMPFLAHALGTFTGALTAAKLAVNHKIKFSMTIAVFFLAGGEC